MAKKSSENSNRPESEDVKAAVSNIEAHLSELLSMKGAYMRQCKSVREQIADVYDRASDQGISKKLLKRIIKTRDLERKIDDQGADLEPDERSEMEMLYDLLGDYALTPLGAAAVAAAGGAPAGAEVLEGIGA